MRILVIEDDPAIGKLVRIAFERDGQDVVHAATGTEGLEMTRTWRPDVVLLDLGLPDVGGLEVTKRIRGESDVPILILTARTLEEERVRGLDLGADDYMVKPFSIPELEARVRAVTRRSRGDVVKPPVAGMLTHRDLSVDTNERRVLRGEEEISLTKREFEILRMLIQQPGKLVARSAISHAVWARSAASAKNLLDVHMSSLRKKLGEDYVETVRGEGFRLVD
jgi:two-component system, OmpR family, response regulator VanR